MQYGNSFPSRDPKRQALGASLMSETIWEISDEKPSHMPSLLGLEDSENIGMTEFCGATLALRSDENRLSAVFHWSG